MNFFNRNKKVFGMTFMVRMIVAFFTIIVLGVSGTVLLADWSGNSTNVYTLGNVGIGADNYSGKLSIVADSDRNAITLANTVDDNVSKGAVITGARRDNSLVPFNGFGTWDNGALRYAYVGGGFNMPCATQISFWTAPVYDETITQLPYCRMIIMNNGYVGIGTRDPISRLHVNGNIRTDADLSVMGEITAEQNIIVKGTTTSTNYACSSDARYKKNISPYKNALEKVLGLRGVSYFWKADEYKERNFSKDKQVGFVAQEVEKVIPELVYTDDKGYKTMSYDRLTAVIVEAIKELKAKNDQKISALEKESRTRISALETENADLKQKLAKLEKITEHLLALETARAMREKKLAVK